MRGKGMKFLDPDDPFFARAWVRWLTVLLPLAWGLFEAFAGAPVWAILFLSAGAYAGWMLFFRRRG